jgi:hypothetical protein
VRRQPHAILPEQREQQGDACWPVLPPLGIGATGKCSCSCAAEHASWFAGSTAVVSLANVCVACWAASARRYFEGSNIKHRWLRKVLLHLQLIVCGVLHAVHAVTMWCLLS